MNHLTGETIALLGSPVRGFVDTPANLLPYRARRIVEQTMMVSGETDAASVASPSSSPTFAWRGSPPAPTF